VQFLAPKPPVYTRKFVFATPARPLLILHYARKTNSHPPEERFVHTTAKKTISYQCPNVSRVGMHAAVAG